MSRDRRLLALQLGHDAEAHVQALMEADGWVVLDRNWHGGGGELDLVVIRDGMLRFVEVRARSGEQVPIEESVTPSKQRKLRRAAEAWMLARDDAWSEVAFLVALVDLSVTPWQTEWIDNAFDGS